MLIRIIYGETPERAVLAYFINHMTSYD